jgi:uncharacterized protein YciI
MREQSGWPGHAAFMDALADEGFVILGGPLGPPGDDRTFLLVMDADSEEAIRARLDADPWTPTRMLHIARIEPWHILLGNAPAA